MEENKNNVSGSQSPSAFWKSLESLSAGAAGSAEAFKAKVSSNLPLHFVSRREFMEWMGAISAVMGLTNCTRQPRENILPYSKQPENVIPGKPLFFATAYGVDGSASGLLVESHEGRPTKIEGNPDHPASLGATDAFAQASILDLYDPDRAKAPVFKGMETTWNHFLADFANAMKTQGLSGGAGMKLLTPTVYSPTLARQIREFLAKYPNVEWVQYDAVHKDNQRAGARMAFGDLADVHYQVNKADVILTLDSDFLSTGAGAVRYSRDFASRRHPEAPGGMNRLYAIECTLTNTGALADHRWPIKPSEMAAVANEIARGVGVKGLSALSVPAGSESWIAAVVNDLKSNAGASLVVAGEFQPAEIHALAHAINGALGNFGKTVIATEPVEAQPLLQVEALRQLTHTMADGAVEVFINIGTNPVYNAPADVDFAGALAKVKWKVQLSPFLDETASLCDWHIPESHYLEAWSDVRAYDGTAAIVQPLIAPIYMSKSAHEFLGALVDKASTSGYDFVQETWKASHSLDFPKFWRRAIHDGVIAGSAFSEKRVTIKSFTVKAPAASTTGLDVVFRPDPTIWDGRFANNGWLQELPKPLSKVTWDNVVALGAATAKKWGVNNGDVIEIVQGKAMVAGPVWIMPGQPEGVAALYLGYGRTRAGRVGNGIGYNAYKVRFSDTQWWGNNFQAKKAGRYHALASTQEHFTLEGRDIIRTGTYEEFKKNAHFHEKEKEAESHEHAPPWRPAVAERPFEDQDYAWGMSIDLNTCTGCNACVVACVSENNIAVVGKDQVMRERHMYWLRVDRYFRGTAENPEVYFQPLPCMHCESAPCEVVCPVNATSHSPEGINEMTYNRCVGTKYCSNNCPYKVRHFNFYLYQDLQTPQLKPMRNPDVTVRARGVMEKCTYCVQRVNAARQHAKLEDRTIRDGEIRTACQQACPSQSIVFGNIKDPASAVSKAKAQPLTYGLLEELNTKPRTTYLARITNPNPSIPSSRTAPAAGKVEHS